MRHLLRRWLSDLHIRDPVIRQQAMLLQVLLIGLMLTVGLAIILSMLVCGFSARSAEKPQTYDREISCCRRLNAARREGSFASHATRPYNTGRGIRDQHIGAGGSHPMSAHPDAATSLAERDPGRRIRI